VIREDRDERYTLAQAFAYCERLTRTRYENYPVASALVPERLRPYLWAIYAFARSADDFADEPRYAGRRSEALADWEAQLHRCYHGEADHPVFIALRETVERCDIPIVPLQNLLTAFGMDLATHRYATFAELATYCAHSAHPIGQLVLYVFGYRDSSLLHYSDDLCTALQLTHFCQNVGADLGRGRIYLPDEDRRHFGVSDEALFARTVTPELRDLMRYQVARARALFERGRPLLGRVGSDLGFELATIWRAGNAVLDKIEAANYDVFRRRIRLHAVDKTRIVAWAATRRWPRWPGERADVRAPSM